MLSSRQRSGSFGSVTLPAAKANPILERSKSTSEPDSGSVMQQRVEQLEEELRREREDKSRAMQELIELPNNGRSRDAIDAERMRLLEREVQVAKETEMKMLESLIHQTKQLEQAKISLEEAKLEVASLRRGRGRQPPPQWSVMDLMFGGVDEELRALRGELRAATHAEERSRKALDELGAALSAVTMEARQVKAWLANAQAELETANTEAERLNRELRTAGVELRSVTEQHELLKFKVEEAAATSAQKEKALLERAHAAEEKVNMARQENAELAKLHRVVLDDNGKLREALERAMAEANAAMASLELESNENTKLNDAIAEKETALQSLGQEHERLKVSEAAAQGHVKELDGLLSAARKTVDGDGEKGVELPPLEQWKGEQGRFSGVFLDSARIMAGRKDRMFTSLSNIAELKSAAAAAAMDDFDYEFDHFDGGRYGELGHAMKHKKKWSILRKFGGLFRRRSLYKSNLAPLVHS